MYSFIHIIKNIEKFGSRFRENPTQIAIQANEHLGKFDVVK
jgi:hypothetical protein